MYKFHVCTYFFDSRFLAIGHEQAKKNLQFFCTDKGMRLEFRDMKFFTLTDWQQCVTSYGIMTIPCVVFDNHIVYRGIPEDFVLFQTQIILSDVSLCSKDGIHIY